MQDQEDKSIAEAKTNIREIIRLQPSLFVRPRGDEWLDTGHIAKISGLSLGDINQKIARYYFYQFAQIFSQSQTAKGLDSRFKSDFIALHQRIVIFKLPEGNELGEFGFYVKKENLQAIGIKVNKVLPALEVKSEDEKPVETKPLKAPKEEVSVNTVPEVLPKPLPIVKPRPVAVARSPKTSHVERVKKEIPEGFTNVEVLANEFQMSLKGFTSSMVRRVRCALVSAHIEQEGVVSVDVTLHHCRRLSAQANGLWISPDLVEVMRDEGPSWLATPLGETRMSEKAIQKLVDSYKQAVAEGVCTSNLRDI